jgi:regulator of RNase E activity RraA
MTMPAFTSADLDALRQCDTPTICNGLELIVPERRGLGFTVDPLVAWDPTLSPMVGVARVGTIRAKEPPRGQVADRGDWYDYVAQAQHPTIVVIQDIDDTPGYGAFWGEVNSALHKALGARGCVTNGSFRDVTAWAEGFQMLGGRIGPSHAHVHVVDFGRPVNVFGMLAGHDDVIHADRHGAVVVPVEAVTKLPAAIALIERRERVILDACRSSNFSAKDLREIMKRSREIH